MASQILGGLSMHRLEPGFAGKFDLTPLSWEFSEWFGQKGSKRDLVSQVIYHRKRQLPQDLEGILLNVT